MFSLFHLGTGEEMTRKEESKKDGVGGSKQARKKEGERKPGK